LGGRLVIQKRNFQVSDETQTPPNLRIDTIKMGNLTILRQIYQSGWQWSKHQKPIAKTDSCQVHHFGVFISGRMRVRADDSQEVEFGPGDVADIPPGHDGWVIGNEPVIFYTFTQRTDQKLHP
jgi:mannose-6-phosphate isomerase-like protein (cupin superfamily)